MQVQRVAVKISTGDQVVEAMRRENAKHRRVSSKLSSSRRQTEAEHFSPSQSTRPDAMGSSYPSLEPVDSATLYSASLARCPLWLREPDTTEYQFLSVPLRSELIHRAA
jgi:hypothetical protein